MCDYNCLACRHNDCIREGAYAVRLHEYYIANKERLNEYSRNYYRENKEQLKEKRKKYIAEHREQINRKQRERRQRKAYVNTI